MAAAVVLAEAILLEAIVIVVVAVGWPSVNCLGEKLAAVASDSTSGFFVAGATSEVATEAAAESA